MERSFLYFKAANPEWEPDEEGQQYLENVSHFALKKSELNAPPLSTVNESDLQASHPPPLPSSPSSSRLDNSAILNSALLVSSVSSLDQSGTQRGGLMSVLDKIYESNVMHVLQ